jgi:predicted anti-sigma-YlaC factor YlaD
MGIFNFLNGPRFCYNIRVTVKSWNPIRPTGHALALLLVCAVCTGCSFKRMAVNKVGDAMAASGGTFASDDDPELIKAAAPFSLKLMESLLAESPKHKGLLFATSSGFTQYAYAFVQQDADELEVTDVAAATVMKARARRLYLRARNYGLRGLEVSHPGFDVELQANAQKAVQVATKKDVPLLYWTAVSWAAAISDAKDDPNLIADLPKVEALIDRALKLDESFDHGAIHSFLITYEMSRQGEPGDPVARAREHFDRAVELSGGQLAGPFVAYAEAVSVQKQDLAGFKSMLERALAIDPDAKPEWRLVNLIMQRRARWLLSRTDELFLTTESP